MISEKTHRLVCLWGLIVFLLMMIQPAVFAMISFSHLKVLVTQSSSDCCDMMEASEKHYTILGIHNFKSGDYEEAIRNFEIALNANRENPQNYFRLGNAQFMAGDYTNAIYSYNQAIELNPDYKNAYYNLAQTYKKTGELEKSKEAYRKFQLLKIPPAKD